MFVRNDMHKSVKTIMKYTLIENRRYKSILKIMERIITNSKSEREQVANYFITSMSHVQIIDEV